MATSDVKKDEVSLNRLPRLDELCANGLAETFNDMHVLDAVPKRYESEICDQINYSDADIPTCAKKVESELFWERLARERWAELNLKHHGMSWKRLYLEKHCSELLEKYFPSPPPDEGNWSFLVDTILAVRPFVRSLRVRHMLCHFDLAQICGHLSNLCVLDLTYGNRSMGIEYDSEKIGMSEDDARVLGRVIGNSKILSRLSVQESAITDELLTIFIPAFERNKTLTCTDLSHNRIRDFGAKQISHWIANSQILTHLSLKHNFIGEEGAIELTKGLGQNQSLLKLDLSLNRIGDQNGAEILKVLKEHPKLEEFCMASNNLGPLSALALVDLIENNQTLRSIDISCNNLHFKITDDTVKDPSPSLGRSLKGALTSNESLCHFDLRKTGFTDEALLKFDKLVAPTRIKLENDKRKILHNRDWESIRFEL